jgi:hypothetical protein
MSTMSTSGLGLGRRYPFDAELLEDPRGLVLFGWVGPRVLYARCKGIVSADLGTAFVDRLGELMLRASAVDYFSDHASVTHYNPVARALFERFVLAGRAQFRSILLLGRSGAPRFSEALESALGESVHVVTSSVEFTARLTQAAPLAPRRLEAKATLRTRVSTLRYF